MAWLGGWCHRKSHVVNQQAGAVVGYQTCIKVYKGAGADGTEAIAGTTVTAGKVYCGGNCQNDFGDIRFTASDGSTLLDYWMMELSAGNYAIFWVRVTDNLGTGNRTIYVYYDTAGATVTTENIATTFPILGDDFDGAAEPPAGWNENNIHDNRLTWKDVSENSYYKVWDFLNTAAWWHGNEIYKSIGVQAGTLAVMFSVFQRNDINIAVQSNSWLELKLAGVSKLKNGHDDGSQVVFGRWYSIITGTANHSAYGTPINTTIIYETLRDGVNYKNYHGGVLQQTKVENTDIDEVRFRVTGGRSLSNVNPHTRFNWVVVREYVSPEPVHGAWGGEEAPTVLAPTNCAANCTSPVVPYAITITWTDNATNETAYYVERNDGGWHVVSGALPAGTQIYVDNTVVCDTLYLYRVRAYYSGCGGIYSNYCTIGAPVTCVCPPPTPEPTPEGVIGGARKPLWKYIYGFKHVPSEKIYGIVIRKFMETQKLKSKVSNWFSETLKTISKKFADKFEETRLVSAFIKKPFEETSPVGCTFIVGFNETQQVLAPITWEFSLTIYAKITGKTTTEEKELLKELRWL